MFYKINRRTVYYYNSVLSHDFGTIKYHAMYIILCKRSHACIQNYTDFAAYVHASIISGIR